MKDGQAARDPLAGPVTLAHRVGRVTQAAQDLPAHQDTVTRTPAWGTTSEVNMTQLQLDRKGTFILQEGVINVDIKQYNLVCGQFRIWQFSRGLVHPKQTFQLIYYSSLC